jgi:hypothetical protein
VIEDLERAKQQNRTSTSQSAVAPVANMVITGHTDKVGLTENVPESLADHTENLSNCPQLREADHGTGQAPTPASQRIRPLCTVNTRLDAEEAHIRGAAVTIAKLNGTLEALHKESLAYCTSQNPQPALSRSLTGPQKISGTETVQGGTDGQLDYTEALWFESFAFICWLYGHHHLMVPPEVRRKVKQEAPKKFPSLKEQLKTKEARGELILCYLRGPHNRTSPMCDDLIAAITERNSREIYESSDASTQTFWDPQKQATGAETEVEHAIAVVRPQNQNGFLAVSEEILALEKAMQEAEMGRQAKGNDIIALVRTSEKPIKFEEQLQKLGSEVQERWTTIQEGQNRIKELQDHQLILKGFGDG